MPKTKKEISLKLNNSSKVKKTKPINKDSFSIITTPTEALPARPNFLNRKTFLILILVGLILLAFYKKGWFVAAMVNGQVITNFELLSSMNSQFRTQTINQIVNEKLLLQEAHKKRVKVTDSEINQKISDLEKNVGSAEALDSLLSQQGQTRQTLRQQIKLQVLVEKIYESEATVSAEEIDKFLIQNKDQLVATEEAKQKEEATQTLKQQKLSQVFNDAFQKLKEQANIKIF